LEEERSVGENDTGNDFAVGGCAIGVLALGESVTDSDSLELRVSSSSNTTAGSGGLEGKILLCDDLEVSHPCWPGSRLRIIRVVAVAGIDCGSRSSVAEASLGILTQNTVVVNWANTAAVASGISEEGSWASALADTSTVVLLSGIFTAWWAGSRGLGDLLDDISHEAKLFTSNWEVDLEITLERSSVDLSPENSVGSLNERRRSKEDTRKSEGLDANRVCVEKVPNNLLSQVDGGSLQDGIKRGITEVELSVVVNVDNDHLHSHIVESTEND